jgi:diamine N-acetyltransferase
MLKANDIYLRALEPTDLDALYEWENNPDWWNITETRQPFSRFELKKYLDDAQLNDIHTNKQLRLVIAENATQLPIGFVDMYDYAPHHHRAGVGILIAPPDKRSLGYATQALHLLCDYAFEMLDMHQLYAHIIITNAASLNLFGTCGFEQTGILPHWIYFKNQWHDVLVLQKIKYT